MLRMLGMRVTLALAASCLGNGTDWLSAAAADEKPPAAEAPRRWQDTLVTPHTDGPPALEDHGPDFPKCAPSAGVTRTYSVTGRETGGPTVTGYADLHLHHFAHMEFGGRVLHGSNELWDHLDNKPLTREQALPNKCSGHWGDHGFLIGLEGPLHLNRRKFGQGWPRWNANTHQQIFVDWLKQAHQDGLKLIVTSIADFEYNCRITPYGRGKNARRSAGSCNYWESAKAQLQAAHDFAGRHDWYKIVTTPREAREAIAAGKLAVILHLEMSGPFGTQALAADWKEKFDILYDQYKVRSFMPAHELDSPFAGASHHESFFKLAQVLDDLGFAAKKGLAALVASLAKSPTDEQREHAAESLGTALLAAAQAAKLTLVGDPKATVKEWASRIGFQHHEVERFKAQAHRPGDGPTWINARGLSDVGKELTREMMKRHMMIDLSHLSRRAVHDTMCIAEQDFNGYPTVHTHGHLQEAMGPRKADEEKSFPLAFAGRLARGGGVFAIRPSADETRQWQGAHKERKANKGAAKEDDDKPLRVPNDCNGSALSFANHYLFVARTLKLNVAFGTDMGGMPMMNARFNMKEHLKPPLIKSALSDDNGACRPRGIKRRVAHVQSDAQEKHRNTGTGTAFDETGLGRIDQLKDVLAQLRLLGVSTKTLESSAEAFLQSWERAYDDGRKPLPYDVDVRSEQVQSTMQPQRYPALP